MPHCIGTYHHHHQQQQQQQRKHCAVWQSCLSNATLWREGNSHKARMPISSLLAMLRKTHLDVVNLLTTVRNESNHGRNCENWVHWSSVKCCRAVLLFLWSLLEARISHTYDRVKPIISVVIKNPSIIHEKATESFSSTVITLNSCIRLCTY